MKYISLFLLAAGSLCAADFLAGHTVRLGIHGPKGAAATVVQPDFTTGQAARLVIGQSTFTAQDTNSSATILGGVGGIAYAADTLFVADSNRVGATPLNHRVLLFNNVSTMLPSPAAQPEQNRTCPICLGQASVVLGQPDFTTAIESVAATPNGLRLPTAVASDGIHLVVADTNHNRVLIWNSIPNVNNQPADVVVGQPDFQSSGVPGNTPNAKSMRGPQGVWIQNGKLYVADTQNNRVLVYNQIPSTNGAAADLVLGEPDMNTFTEPDLTQQTTDATAKNMLNPVSVTSDGVRLFVTDLGYNRVLIWNSIPATNDQAADLVLGQPNLTSSIANNAFSGTAATSSSDTKNKQTPVLCTVSNGKDPAGNPTYPPYCNATLSFPRFALSDGHRLFVADGGNDRVLVYEQLPTQNGQAGDLILGQIGGDVNQASDAADSMRTPMSLAWDGTNLYVSDTFNRRILVYSVGTNPIPYQGVRNAASFNIFALGHVAINGTITANDKVTITICSPPAANTFTTGCISPAAPNASSSGSTIGTDYTYTVQAKNTLDNVVNGLVAAINAGSGDPNVIAAPNLVTETVLLAAKTAGPAGNNIAYTTSATPNATILATAGGGTLSGGGDAAKVGAGTVVSIIANPGTTLTSDNLAADMTQNQLPKQLGGTTVYFNGIQAPLFFVSPTLINAQIPWEVTNTTSINAYVRAVAGDGSVTVTTPVAATIVTQNPGIFTQPNSTATPPPGIILHGSSYASGVVLVDGTIQPGDVATVKVGDRSYSYTVQVGDTLDSVRNALVLVLNQDPAVSASAGIAFARNFVIRSRLSGPEANGIPFSTSVSGPTGSSGAQLILTPETTTLCCANIAYSPVTLSNPAVPGEVLILYATGLGQPVLSEANQGLIVTGA